MRKHAQEESFFQLVTELHLSNYVIANSSQN